MWLNENPLPIFEMVKPSRHSTSFQTGSADRFTLPDLIRPYWRVLCLHRQCGSDLADNGGLLGEQQWGLRGGGGGLISSL